MTDPKSDVLRWVNPYGPATDAEFLIDGLKWAYKVLQARDEMNAAIHCGEVRYSPVTVKVGTALGLAYEMFKMDKSDA